MRYLQKFYQKVILKPRPWYNFMPWAERGFGTSPACLVWNWRTYRFYEVVWASAHLAEWYFVHFLTLYPPLPYPKQIYEVPLLSFFIHENMDEKGVCYCFTVDSLFKQKVYDWSSKKMCTFSPVQDGCVQLRMDGDLQANETSTDKMS